jgi:hypothetical protein
MADKQTVCVELGDRMRAELWIDGEYATAIELPVGSPPLGSNHRNSMQTARLHWVMLGLPSTAADLPASTRRISEDLAQVGLRVRTKAETHGVQLVNNMFVVTCWVAGSVSVNGSLQIGPTGGAMVTVPISASANGSTNVQNAHILAEAIAAQVAAVVPWEVRVADAPQYNSSAIVVNPGSSMGIQTAGLTFNPAPPPPAPPQLAVWYNDPTIRWTNQPPVFNTLDALMFCMNYKDDATFSANAPGADTIDMFVIHDSFFYIDDNNVADPNAHGWSFDWSFESDVPGLCGATFIHRSAVDAADDSPLYMTVGHEIVHQLARTTRHLTDPTHLMLHPFPGATVLESPERHKRLPDSVSYYSSATIRLKSGAFASPRLLFEDCN